MNKDLGANKTWARTRPGKSERNMSYRYRLGERVVIVGHAEFPVGATGTISLPPRALLVALAEEGEWKQHRTLIQTLNGTVVGYFVRFDRPTDDGSGDGPYGAAVLDESCLQPIAVGL